MNQTAPRFGRIIKLLSQRWRESETDLTLETAIVGLIARGQLSDKEGARWLSRVTSSPQLAAILRNFASGDWDEQKLKDLLRSYKSANGETLNAPKTEAVPVSPNGKVAALLAQRWDDIQQEGQSDDDLANEKAIVGLIARGELSEREGARWLSRLTTSPQFAAILRNYASDSWDDDRFKALFRAYKADGDATLSRVPAEAAKRSPDEKVADMVVERWRDADDDLAHEKAIVGLIARGELSEREGARWLSRLTTSPQFAAILRSYASDSWDDERFRALFRAYKADGDATLSQVPAQAAKRSPDEKVADMVVERWRDADDDLAHEKAIVGLIARGHLSEREGARWLSRLTTSPQFAALLRNYASDNWDDEKFKTLFRSYNALPPETSPSERIAKQLLQRWDDVERSNTAADEMAQEKAIVALIARGELSEREGARWLSRLTTNPQFAAMLRNYASDNWDDDRFGAFFRAYTAVPPENSPSEKIAKQLVQRWDHGAKTAGDELAQEKAIVGLVARGELSEREGARWLSRLTTNPQFAALLRNYASDEWDDDRFRSLFRAYKAVEGEGGDPSQNDKIAKQLAQRWDNVERSEASGERLAQEKSIVALIARGELSEREGARWLSRLTTNPQFAAILRNYASDNWDDDRFKDLFRSYKNAGREEKPFGTSIANSSADDKIAMMMIDRWRTSEEDLAYEKAIVGLIARGQLSDKEGARWLSRFTQSPQFSTILRHYASDDWDDDRFNQLFRSYKTSETDEGLSEAARSPFYRVAKLLVQRWETSSEELLNEKAIVSLIVRGQMSDKESARWLSRFVSSPSLSKILRDYALNEWSEKRFSSIHRLLRDNSEGGATAPDSQADNSKNDRTVRMLADRWRDTGDELGHEKSIVSLIARGQLSERDGARWLSRIVASPHVAAVLRDYASDDWDEVLFREVFRIYRTPNAPEDAVPEIGELAPSAPAQSGLLGRFSKKRRIPLTGTKYIVLNSFPKSGNTWVRQFLSCLCFDGDLAAIPDHYHHDINQAPTFKMPNGDAVRFYKSHDKALPTILDGRVIEHAGAIHIRRHPLDVFISYLNFMHLSRVESERSASRSSPFIIEAENLSDIVGQDLTWAFLGVFMLFGTVNPKFQSSGSWFQNAEEWAVLQDDMPLVSLKYESLIENGADDLMGIGEMLGKSPDDVRAAFARAQDLTVVDGRFFWRQEIGTHKSYLSPAQIEAFYKVHGDKLRKFGY